MYRATSRGSWKASSSTEQLRPALLSAKPNSTPYFLVEALFTPIGHLTDALGSYPNFTNTGDNATKLREAAAFFANVDHETAGLKFVVEQNRANYPNYCDVSQPYGCPAGQSAYYGRGPLMVVWNFNYKAAGDALHTDLLHNPRLLETDAPISWKSALWMWNTQKGAGTMTSHDAMVGNNRGFGETIRTLAGDLECNGKNPDERDDRINTYKKFAALLRVNPGGKLSC
ncbi:lysozyme-like domain-containing protein [Trichoderma evansii]